MFANLAGIAEIHKDSAVLEVGCGTGQATHPVAALGCSMTAIELGIGMADVARRRQPPGLIQSFDPADGWR